MASQHAVRETQKRKRERPPERSRAPAATRAPAPLPDLLELQQSLGNRAVQRLLGQGSAAVSVQRWTQADVIKRVPNAPAWAGDEAVVRQVQRQLRRLGLYRLGIDGDYGRGTDAALVEAFGGDEFRALASAAALERLQTAQPPEGKRGEHALRYGEMFRDGLLDMTLGIGYDEALEQDPDAALNNYRAALAGRGFTEDAGAAAEVYRQAGRSLQGSIAGQYYVKRNALVYNPPASTPRPIHAVIRLVSNPRGDKGAEALQAFREGMANADVIFYAGHGRYGTGPDFDRNFGSFVLHDLDDHAVTQPPILDYEVLERTLQQEVRRRRLGRSPWRQFLWRYEHGLVDVEFKNAGNLRINPRNLHAGEFGADLINWALNQSKVKAETGPGSQLTGAGAAGANPEQRYRVAVFNGCRTRDYE
ncbi:MAG: peptidoglycan-binding protein, partial [Chloroflexi bacterium]|nr:peptidoglycan-binding protein [Chloroflexota bacterium]